jgi:methionine sulfoxide reductase heme-binding subunit
MRKHVLMYLAIFGSVYAIALAISLLTELPFSNLLGCLALISYLCTVSPSLAKAFFPHWKRNKPLNWLLRYRRYVGVSSFSLALNHGVLQMIKRELNLLDPLTYVHYFQGFSMLLILTLLAFTSSDESVKSMKRNWKKLHGLTYLIILILPWHILDKMAGRWSLLTPLAVLFSLTFVALFLVRLCKERFLSLT